MSILKIKDSQGNWIGVPTVKGDTGNGISSTALNDDYTLTLSFTDGTTYTTPSIRGEKGEQGDPATSMEIHICSASEYDAETRIPTIANPNDKTFYLVPTEDGTSPDLFTEWVYVNNAWEMFGSASVDLSGYLTDVKINGNSVVTDGVANIPKANSSTYGVVKVNGNYGIGKMGDGSLTLMLASERESKDGTNMHNIIAPINQHISTFYGLAKASGDTTQSQSDNPVGTYTDEAKASIKNMLGVEDVDIDSKAPVITETISGDIASFPDGADDIPLKSCIVQVNPVQDLHGYDHPWPAGGGKNKFNEVYPSIVSALRYMPIFVGDGTYTLSTSTPLNTENATNLFLLAGNVSSGASTADNGVYAGHPKTVESVDGYVTIAYRNANGVNPASYETQLELGSTATDYAPYSNECPISGFTGCEVQRTGINIFDGEVESGDYDVTESRGGAKRNNASRMRCANFIPVKPNTIYYSKLSYTNGIVVFYDEEKWMHPGGYAVARNTTFTTPSWCKYITFYYADTQYNNDISINYPATGTEYHPYTGQIYPIIFPSEAGTVYGGYVDVLNGELVVDRAMVVFDGSSDEQWAYYAVTQGNLFRLQSYSTMKPTADIIPAISNAFKAVLQANRTNGTISSGIGGTNIDFVFDGANSLAEWMEWLAENNVQLCYELATPIHYPITSNQINSLYGQNNLWANTGDTEVEYRADTELYIDKQIPDVPVDDVQINGTSVVSQGIAEIPIGTTNDYGVLRIGSGLMLTNDDKRVYIAKASDSLVKSGTNSYAPIVPSNQHTSAFYGLAKAAGDTTQSSSSNTVGTYTDSAKTAIKQMLGVKDDYDSLVVEVSGTDPVITGKASYRYNCGELYTLSITPPSSGTMDIIFTSGATPTVLTLPETVKMPDWWAGIETNTTYEMCITDGVYCGVMSWAT